MAEKTLKNIRKSFLNYFANKDHKIVDSSNLVPNNDPTLMFTNSGMVQFKNVFTGLEKRDYKRAVTSQKCVRAGGKHNDLENVGYTPRHHTFFEMLGNFSFGDYFKDKAISLAWDLITKEFGLKKDRLYVTVFNEDNDAFNLWKKISGLSEDRIIKISTSDNFWSMGETGPCGPCSEIFYDHGDHLQGGPPGSKNQDGDRFIEIWNLVFMQFEQVSKNKRVNLPKPSVDTGMGLERISALLQGTHDNYEIDHFKNLIEASSNLTKTKVTEKNIASHRVISDHLRASSFLIAEGVLPSNEGRGYVLRRIMRRGMRHSHALGSKEPIFYKIVPTLIKEMSDTYQELNKSLEEKWFKVREQLNPTEFLGYEFDKLEGVILKISKGKDFVEEAKTGDEVEIVTNQTPFYAESGGQIGDQGVIYSNDCKVIIKDTQKKIGDLYVHFGKVNKGSLKINQSVNLEIDVNRRNNARAYHSATHLLHEALRRTLGKHVTQKGSLVSPEKLRFDFSHNKPIEKNEIEKIERYVNDMVRTAADVKTRIMTPKEAVEKGALAMFGEKYGDEVRVLSMGKENGGYFSTELCGGTHVKNTKAIGKFKIISQSSIDLELSANIKNLNKQLETIKIQNIIKDNSKNVIKDKKIGSFTLRHQVLTDFPPKELRSIVDQSKKDIKEGIVVGFSTYEGKVGVAVGVTINLTKQYDAVKLVKIASEVLGGKGGGGRKDFAQAGGTNKDKIEEAFNNIIESIK